MKKSTLLLIMLLLIKGSSFAQINKHRPGHVFNPNKINHLLKKTVVPINPAAIIFTDNMDGDNTVAGLVARGYATYYRGGGPAGLLPEWLQGEGAIFVAYNGPDSGYVGSSYNSVTGANDVDNWLVLPAVSVSAGDSLSFYVQASPGSTFPDSVKVMYNPTGATLPEDVNWVMLDDFEATTSGNWERKAYALPSASANATIAIRHAVVNGGPSGVNSDYVGIDQIDVFNNIITPPTADECAGAADINSGLGGAIGTEMVLGPYNNDTATTGAQDPTVGFACFGEPNGGGANPTLDNTLWFTFTGDGEIYFIETGNCAGVTNYINDGDTQFALYSGNCGSLTPVACNEDGPNAVTGDYKAGFTITTTPGTVYYLIVDGFNFNGALSTGEFCLKITHQPAIVCGDTTITSGTQAVNDTNICFNDTLMISTTGAVAPNGGGGVSGLAWVLTTTDISGSVNPIDTATYIGSFSIQNPPPAVSSINFINDGSQLPAGTYYWTPIIFGNAVDTTGGGATFISQLLLDSNCTTTGTSMMINFLLQGDPLCTPPLVNDECPGAADINSSFGGLPGVQMNAGIFDNTTATHSALDPATGYTCFGEPDGSGSAADSLKLDNTMWFTFTGDGLAYRIETANCAGVTNYINDGDAQMVIYHGACGNLIPDTCNEDIAPGGITYESGFGNFLTVAGTVYYIMIDGFNFNGALSDGEFCLLITRQTGIGVNENIPGKNVSLSAYPSPAKDILNIEFTNTESTNAVISVTDNIGRTVQSNTIGAAQGLNKTSVNVKSLAAGSYMVNVKTNEGSRTIKFIKD